jgi:hypothetical protein
MSLTESDTELALILPHRSGLPLVESTKQILWFSNAIRSNGTEDQRVKR